MSESESRIQQRVRYALTEVGTFFRINAGEGWTGRAVRTGADVLIRGARRLRTGVPPGYPDITGWVPIEITADMVGQRIAVFAAVEVKSPTGRLSPKQESFLDKLKRDGGIAIVARSPEDVTWHRMIDSLSEREQ